MGLTIAFLTVIFLFIAFLPSQLPRDGLGPFSAYFFYEMNFILRHMLWFFVGFFILFLLFFRTHPKSHPPHQKMFRSLAHSISVFFISFFTASGILFFLGLLQLNIVSIMLHIHPGTIGLISDTKTIVSRLKTAPSPPTIVASEEDQHQELQAIAATQTGKENVYGRFILPSIPSFLVIPMTRPSSSMFLVDNTLIMTKIQKEDLQAVSPLVGYYFVKGYFLSRYIKPPPQVAILTRDEYLQYRSGDANEKVRKIDAQLKKVEEKVSSLSASIETDRKRITDGTIAINQSLSQRNADYRKCTAAGKTDTACKDLFAEKDADIQKADQDSVKLTKSVESRETQLGEYKKYLEFYKVQRIAIQASRASIQYENGVFTPANSIAVTYGRSSPHAIADYLEVLTHEYLHYASFVPGRQLTNRFFEEGLTEYFARRAIKQALNIDTNIGYPVEVKIISGLTNLITDDELAEIYFTKDEKALESALDRVYGDGFYAKNEMLFESLQYATNLDQLLTQSNTIMKKIGAAPLRKEDLISSTSSL